MQSFEGFLDRVNRQGSTVSARFVVGGFDPNPTESPVVVVSVHLPEDVDALYESLLQVQGDDNGCYLAVHSNGEATLATDHGQEILFKGSAVSILEENYDLQDYERIAKQCHSWGMENYKAFVKQSEVLHRMQGMLREQMTRVLIKAQGHPPGTTAHTLYAQQRSFLSRALSDGEA